MSKETDLKLKVANDFFDFIIGFSMAIMLLCIIFGPIYFITH